MRNKRTHGRGEWWKPFPVSSVPPSSVTVALVALMPEAMVTEVRSDYLTPGPNATPHRGLCCRVADLLLC